MYQLRTGIIYRHPPRVPKGTVDVRAVRMADPAVHHTGRQAVKFKIPVEVEMTPEQARVWLELEGMTRGDLIECLTRCVLRGARSEIPLGYGLVDLSGDVTVTDDAVSLVAGIRAALEVSAKELETHPRWCDFEYPFRVLSENIGKQFNEGEK